MFRNRPAVRFSRKLNNRPADRCLDSRKLNNRLFAFVDLLSLILPHVVLDSSSPLFRDQIGQTTAQEWCVHHIIYLNLSPTLCVGRRGSTGRVSVLRARGSEFEPWRRQLFSFFFFFSFLLDTLFLVRAIVFGPLFFHLTVQYNQNEPQHQHSRWRPSIESRVRSLSRVIFFFLFLVSFTLPLLSDVRGVPFGPLFFRATRHSLPTSPTPKSKMAG